MKKVSLILLALFVSLFCLAQSSVEDEENELSLLKNGYFNSPLSTEQPLENGVLDSKGSWALFFEGDAKATIIESVLKVEVIDNGPNDWSVQLLQSPIKIERGGQYKIVFDGKAESNQSLAVKIGGTALRGWTAYFQQQFELTPQWNTYESSFTMYQGTDEDARFEFWFLDNGNYFIDNVKLIKTGDQFLPEEGTLTEEDENEVENWKLIWEEDFDTIDPDVWTFELGSPDWNGDGIPDRWGNNELQYYTDKNASIQDGKLVITAKEETITDMNTTFYYTSSRMITKGKYEVQYGRIEVRAKMPVGQGIWPAIWMLGNDIDDNPSPACGEIDIMEYLGHEPNKVYGTVHGPISAGTGVGSYYILENGNFNDDFHVFALEWDEDEIEFYVDDVLYCIVNKYEIGEEDWVFDHPFFFILNVAVGGNWPGYPDETTVFPQSMEVDYIKVYEDIDQRSITGLEVWDSEYEKAIKEKAEEIENTDGGIVNGDFEGPFINDQEGSPDNWYIWVGKGGKATGNIVNGEFKMDIEKVGNQTWSIQLVQFVKLRAGDYTLSLKARADEPRDILVLIQHEGDSWTVYGQKYLELTSEMQEFTVDVSLPNDDIPKLSINYGKTPNGKPTTVYVDDVKISPK